MSRYIDADKVITFIRDNCEYKIYSQDTDGCRERKFIRENTAADVQKVKHGKWIKKANEIFTYHYVVVCSVCGKEAFYDEVHGYYDDENYCHNCGARMDGDT